MFRLWNYLIVLMTGALWAEPAPADSLRAASAGTISDIDSLWGMAQLGGNIGYIIMLVLALGLFLILLKAINLLMDRRASSRLLDIPFSQMSVDEIEKKVHTATHTVLGSTLAHLIDFHRAGGHADSMHNELVYYMGQENEKFDTYRSWLVFLSDSAGALGLLGTVWGVFLTFFGGNLDSEKILSGMGVALITTLLGLVVSLILNLFSTQLYGTFQRRLELVTRKADELRLYLLHAEHRPAAQPAVQRQSSTPATAPVNTAANGSLPRIHITRVRAKDIMVNEEVKGAIQLQIKDHLGAALPGSRLVARAEGPLLLAGGNGRLEAQADKNGLAVIDIKAGVTTGNGRIIIRLRDQEQVQQSVDLLVKAAPASNLVISGGNDQAGTPNTVLPEPLKLVVTDAWGNPVQEAVVQLQISMGSGAFTNGKNACLVKPDHNGAVEMRFRLGADTGFHVVQASLQGGSQPPVEFRILSKN